jgi:hypothetical protein
MERIARQIATDCGQKLTAVIATHRHKDHISGFAMDGNKGPGAIIRRLKPDIVLQPWTEDPQAARDATKPTKGLKGPALQARLHVQSLLDMNRYAGAVQEYAKSLGKPLKKLRDQLEFLGEDNSLANRAAIDNLRTMGSRPARYLFAGARSGLEPLLPGVKIHVLGPPTLQQDSRIQTQTDTQKDEFWHLRRAFWAKRAAQAKARGDLRESLFPRHEQRVPWVGRWFVRRAQQEQAESMLSIVRTLDDAMNNTSLILLFEFGSKCLLFPGDAQWENWRHALSQEKIRKLLARVTLYKVGHHGSLNATPKSLWHGFANTGGKSRAHRLMSVLSTRDGVHGSEDARTEVPRGTLVDELSRKSTLVDTRASGPNLASVIEDAG